jgi:predicted PurR-regulated permease PerM
MANINSKKIQIEISTLTLFKILFFIVLVAILVFLRDVVLLLLVALILASAIDPWVDWLNRRRIPRTLAIFLIYLLAILIILSSIYILFDPLSTEIKNLAKDFPFYWDKLSFGWSSFADFSKYYGIEDTIQNTLSMLQNGIASLTTNILGGLLSFFGSIFSIGLVLVITFYLALYDNLMKKKFREMLPVKYQPYTLNLINRIQAKIGLWFRGQILLCFVIFCLSLVGLWILGIKYFFVLALFAGIVEIIPYLGPFIGAVPAIFVAFTQSPVLGVSVLILYIVIQQFENYFITPQIMKKAVGMNPVIVIIAMIIGAKVAGIIGIVLAVPVTTAISIVVNDILVDKNKEKITE